MTLQIPNRFKHLVLIFNFGILLSLPVLLFGFPYPTHDGHFHEVWYSNFAAQFWNGELYPRWLQELDGGLGGPTFYFYPPVPFFITGLLQPLFQDETHSWRILGVSAALALLLSGFFAYAWLRQLASKRAATIAAILYMVMPYHYAVDLHIRGALGEFWSFVWMPLILFFVTRVSARNGLAIVGLAVSYALLIMTHLPTTLIFSIIPLIYSFWTAPPGKRTSRLIWTQIGMGLGVGLSGIFLLPAMLGQDAIPIQAMRGGPFYYENRFFFPHPNSSGFVLTRDDFQNKLFWMVMATAGVGASAWFLATQRAGYSPRTEIAFWAIIGLCSLGMMFPISKPIYEWIAQLQLIQFPWRFSAILSVAVVGLIALAFDRIRKPYSVSQMVALVAGGVFLVPWFVFTVQPLQNTLFSRDNHLSGPPSEWKAYNSNTREYRPRWSLTDDMRNTVKRLRNEKGELTKASIVEGGGVVVVQQWKPRSITLALDGTNDMTLEVSQYYYPGWVATLNEQMRLAMTPSMSEGLISLPVPAGRHVLQLRLTKSKPEELGELLSAAFGGIVSIFGVIAFWQRWNTKQEALISDPGRPEQS